MIHGAICQRDAVNQPILRDLVGHPLTSVVFVMDYLQLVFDDLILSLYFWPELEEQGSVHAKGGQEYEKLLTSWIGLSVEDLHESDSGGYVVRLGKSKRLILNPTGDDLTGPEVMVLSDAETGRSAVWQAGVVPFVN